MKKVIAMICLLVTGAANAGSAIYDDSILPRAISVTPKYERKTLSNAELNAGNSQVTVDLSKQETRISVEKPLAVKSAELELEALQHAQAELAAAREIREKAEAERWEIVEKQRRESAEILKISHERAELLVAEAKMRKTIQTLDPVVVLNQSVTQTFDRATIKEIVTAIMPDGWKVTMDLQVKPEIANQRFMFRTTDRRDVALRTFFSQIRYSKLYYQYFWDLADKDGNPSPEIIITDVRRR